MSRWTRWQFAVPRLLLAVVILLSAQFGLGVAIRAYVEEVGEATVGSRVEVAHARLSLLQRQLVLSNFRVADPRDSSQNLLEADRCELNFATAPLLRKQTVV